MRLADLTRNQDAHAWLTLGLVFTLTFAFGSDSRVVGQGPHEKPNVLFIAVDDLNNWAGGIGEYPHAKTPHIDRLAERGVLFRNAHCAAPACNPSRASVVTGVRPSTSGVYFNWQDWRACENLQNVVTLPQHFRDHGYRVLGGGKIYHAANLSDWGLEGYLDPRPWHEYFPSLQRQLADEVTPAGTAVNGSNQFYRGRFDWDALEVDDNEMGDGKVVTWAEEQLSKKHDAPLFLGVGIYRPHIPWHTPKHWFDEHPLDHVELPIVKSEDLADVPEIARSMARQSWHEWMVENEKWREAVQAYLASVSFADAMVGRLLQALDSGPLANNTVIVLWSDHGYHLGHKEHWEKFALWEQTTQVPILVATPQMKPGSGGHHRFGHGCDRPVSLLDLYPTLVELCGLTDPPHLEGESLVPMLQDPARKSDRMVVTTQGLGNHSVRSQDWRYTLYSDGSQELYDHRNDPREFVNVMDVPENGSVVARLRNAIPKTNAALNPVGRGH